MVVAWIREWSFHTRNNFVSIKSLGQKEFVKRSVNVHQSWTHSKSSATAGKYWGDKATSKGCIQEMETVCNRLGEGETLDRGSLWQEDGSIKRKREAIDCWCSSNDSMIKVVCIFSLLLWNLFTESLNKHKQTTSIKENERGSWLGNKFSSSVP